MNSFTKVWLVLLAAVTLAASATNAQTVSSTSSTNTPPAAAKPKSKQYAGKITSVDSAAKTFAVTSASGVTQTLHITSVTRIKKDNEPATSADIVVGENVKGSERKDDSGNWVARTVNMSQTKPKAAAPSAAPQ